ncbi:hypothetical protein J2S09_000329 [Bacillus fengqiuensis]|nr:hypothetical protein [Bacillus fengqiuensis]
MGSFKRYAILLLTFPLLVGFGVWLVEVIEGNKITTTEHIDFGVMNIFFGSIFGFVAYVISILPFTLLFEKFFNKPFAKFIVYTFIGYMIGRFVFEKSYLPHHVEEYHLNELTSILVFGFIGCLYAIIDIYTFNKIRLRSR